jgi:hypothetical protein
MHRLLALVSALVVAASLGTAVAVACGGGDPMNLHAPATLRPALRAVFLKAHPNLRAEDVYGPIPGRTYYGTEGDFHAVATFEVAGHLAEPSVFWSMDGKQWKFVKDTHGGVSWNDVDPMLMALWGFKQWQHTHFWVEPR